MLRSVILFIWLLSTVILQFTVLPSYLEDPFKPNLIIILVSYLALREDLHYSGALLAYILGLIHGTFSGIYFGLAGITMLMIYILLKAVADQLYAESGYLMIVAVFAASLLDAIISLLLFALLSTEAGVYNTLLATMVPQAIVTAFAAFVIFTAVPFARRRLSW